MHIRIRATARVLLWVLPVATIPLTGYEAESQPAETRFTSKVGRFSVEVPARPVQTETRRRSFIGTVTNHIFTAETGEAMFTVDYSDIPHVALDFAGADTIYEHAKGALLLKTFGKPTSYTDVIVGGAKGKRLIYDTPPVSGHAKMRGDAILLLVDVRLYVVDGVVPEGESDAELQRFLSSFEVVR